MRREELVVNILAILEKKPMHGYSIAKILERNGIRVSWGTLYPLLREMKKKGLVKAKTVDKRKVYRITDKGKRFLREKLSRNFFTLVAELKELVEIQLLLSRIWFIAVSMALGGKKKELEELMKKLNAITENL